MAHSPVAVNHVITEGASASGKSWKGSNPEHALCEEMSRLLSCPLPIAQLLAVRGLRLSELAIFFEPGLAELHSPFLLKGMEIAVPRILAAVRAREPILIYGDYDVDGTTATVLLKTAIDRIARTTPESPSLVSWHVPHRLREGYGIQGSRLAQAAAAGVRLVISVDTGVRAFAAAEEARKLGLDLIVTDHHLPDVAGLPSALAVINPQQADCPYPFKELCGAGLAFKLAHGLLEAHAAEAPDAPATLRFLRERLLPSLLKLVAIATIADSVPLLGENRAIVALGLRELANPVQPGLRALLRVAALPLDRAPSVMDVSFRLGPRINAAGRMDVADDVVELFLTRSPERAAELAEKLDRLNEERRATEQSALTEIEAQLAALLDANGAVPTECLILDHPAWHRGVLGILASRVVERTGRPALVFTHEEEQAHGSGRSVAGFHLLDALTGAHCFGQQSSAGAAPEPGLLTRFGGHAHAVGLSLPSAKLPELRERLRSISQEHDLAASLSPAAEYDLELQADELSTELVAWLERCAPFGAGFPEPLLLVRHLRLREPVRLIKDRHICLSFQRAAGQPPLQALGWSRAILWASVSKDLQLAPGSSVDLLGRLSRKCTAWYTGLELSIEDLRSS